MTQAPEYLLHTNILSDLIRHPQGRVRDHIEHAGERRVGTSIVVAAELRFGALKRGSARLSERVETVLSILPILPLEPDTDRAYAEMRFYLEQRGTPIGPNDLLIAAQARDNGLTLVTANEQEFNRVPELAVVNWLV